MAVHGRYIVEVGLYVLIAAGIVITGQVVYGWRKPVVGLLSEEAVDVAELVAEHTYRKKMRKESLAETFSIF